MQNCQICDGTDHYALACPDFICWEHCSIRMPADGDTVLVRGTSEMVLFFCRYEAGEWIRMENGDTVGNVDAWFRIPDPPSCIIL